MICGSNRKADRALARRPPGARRPFGGWLRRAAAGALVLLAGCATPPTTEALRTTTPPGALRIVDERGPLAPGEARTALRQLAREGGEGLLPNYLTSVDEAIRAPLVLGNDAHLLIDGPSTRAAMFRAIRRARHNIHLQTYILEAGEQGDELAALLVARRRHGVRVKLLYDSLGSHGTPQSWFDRLKAAGIAVCEFNPINPLKADTGWQVNNRGHRKILVVDGRVAFTGGINVSDAYTSGSFDSGHRASVERGWRDTDVEARGPVVAEFQRLFLDAWQRQGCRPAAAGDEFPRLARRGSMAMRVVAADPQSDRSELYLALLSAVDRARERVWLTYAYFVPDERMLEALEAAAARGVDVRLVLPGFSDFWAPLYAGRSHYSELLDAGVHIFERRDALLHAKTAVIDGVWSSVGSTNLDWRSFVHNYEADLVVLDGQFGREMEALFRLDESASHELDARAWHRRGLHERLLEAFARVWARML